MLITVLVAIEACVLAGSLINFAGMRLISGRDFSTARKATALQAVIVIILLVFYALISTATAQQHDGASKTTAGRLSSAIQSYAANSGGRAIGFSCASTSYCNGITDQDSSAAPVEGSVATSTSGVVYDLGKNCKGDTSPSTYSVYYWQQRSNSSACLDSN